MPAEASFGIILVVLGLVIGSSLIKEPVGGGRKLFRLLGGPFLFGGDGANGASGAQKVMRLIATLALLGGGIFMMVENLR